MPARAFSERFWSKVGKRGTDECWPWLAYVTKDGYGRLSRTGAGNGMVLAHRAAYELAVGAIPEGLDIDHTCHDPKACPGGVTCAHRHCVNPAHLKPATNYENVMRGNSMAARHAAVTHCPQGHPYSGSNLYVQPNGGRECRACRRARSRATRARKVAQNA